MLPRSVYDDEANIYCDKPSMCLAALKVRYFMRMLLMNKTTDNIFQFQMCALKCATLCASIKIFLDLCPLEQFVTMILMKV